MSRIKIERAIYKYSLHSKNYVIIGYDKNTKTVKNLAKFNNIHDARKFRDSNIRYAKYGKGIRKIKNKYIAEVMLFSTDKKDSDKVRKTYYIGAYDSLKEAKERRLNFIEKLK